MASGGISAPLDPEVAAAARRMTRHLRRTMPNKENWPIKEKLTLVNEAQGCCFARAKGRPS
jgi:hypothetical protein